MSSLSPAKPARGRPRTITRERIADAGIQMGLPQLTFVGIAAQLGVSHVALYQHVPSLDALRRLVAEAIFERWQMPMAARRQALPDYLARFSDSLRGLVGAHPGLAPFLIRRGAKTPSMVAKIDAHHEQVARPFSLSRPRTHGLPSTVAYHCVALADTVYAQATESQPPPPAASSENVQAVEAAIEAEITLGMRALIVGALALLHACRHDSSPDATVAVPRSFACECRALAKWPDAFDE
ncbi:MAG: TetR/AcrR family transcriptional regulator [Bordetella sp.]|nr:TetR/AcrR family transcriptional regulator [Bordetella sp.]